MSETTVAASRSLGHLVQLAPGVVARIGNVNVRDGRATLGGATVHGALFVRVLDAGLDLPLAATSVVA